MKRAILYGARKPKFRVGEIVCVIGNDHFQRPVRIAARRRIGRGWLYIETYGHNQWGEEELRKQTKREKGASCGKQ